MAIPRRWRPQLSLRVTLAPSTSLFQIPEHKAVPVAALSKQAVQLVDCLGSTVASAVVPMEKEKKPPQLGPRDIDALSPPRDTSATGAVTEQRIRQFQDETLSNGVQAFSKNHQVCCLIPLFFTPSGQPRPVVEVARELVGLFLICRESNVVMRIVETEAYQEHEELFLHRFSRPPPNLRGPAGWLVSYIAHQGQKFMFITAGADDSQDVVLLRTCSAVHGYREISNRVKLNFPVSQFQLTNMMSGPSRVYKALVPELGRDCDLLTSWTGLYLVQKDPNPLIILNGTRVLPRNSTYTTYSTMRGFDSRFRFACYSTSTLMFSFTLLPIENQPLVESSTYKRLPASDGSIR